MVSWVIPHLVRRLLWIVWFYLQIGRKIEPTSGLEPLTPAPATSLLACVLARPDASGNCACWGVFDDQAVSLCPLCTSPVAVRVALHAWSSIRAWDEASDVGQGMSEVSIGRAPSSPTELIVGRRNDSVAATSAEGWAPSTLLFRFSSVPARDAATVRRRLVASCPLPRLPGPHSMHLSLFHRVAGQRRLPGS